MMLPLILLTLGCSRREPNPCPLGCLDDTAAADPDDTAAGDTGEQVSWDSPPDDCAPPAPSGSDPFVLSGSVKNTEDGTATWFTEILDIAWLPDEERVVTAGQGGVVVFDLDDPTAPVTRGHLGAGEQHFLRYYNLLPIEAGLTWATHRELGLDVIDLSDPDTLSRSHRSDGLGFEGLSRAGDTLYVASTLGTVEIFDVSVPTAPEYVRQLSGLGRPWDVLVVGDHAYVADAALGLVVLSIAEPTAPAVVDTVESPGQPFRLTHDDGVLYMVSGSGGVEVFDLSDPASPERVHTVDVGGGALDVAAYDGLIGVVTQEAVALLDVGRAGTPADPIPFAYEETEQFAMTIDAGGGYWAVGDWNILGMWEAAEDSAPAADLSTDLIAYLDGAEVRTFEVTNRGGQRLSLSGIAVPDGVVASATTQHIAPGQSATISLSWDGAGPLDDATVCVASNDPGRPTISLTLTSGADGVGRAIGQNAPDFALPDLDGATHRLSEQRGSPVVLAYFATW